MSEAELRTGDFRYRRRDSGAWEEQFTNRHGVTGRWSLCSLATSNLLDRVQKFREKLFAMAREQNHLAGAIVTIMERYGVEGQAADAELLDAVVEQKRLDQECLRLHKAGTDLWEMVEPLIRKAREWKEHRMSSDAPLNTREQGLFLAIRHYEKESSVHPVEALRDLAVQEAERTGLGVDHESFDQAKEEV